MNKTKIKMYKNENNSPDFQFILKKINWKNKKDNLLLSISSLLLILWLFCIITSYTIPSSIADNNSIIKELTIEYENTILKKRCLKNQLDRINWWKKITENFCDLKENLESFRNKKVEKIEVKNKKIAHKGWSIDDERQDWLNYAYKLWGKDFVLTLLAENGTMSIDRKSGSIWVNWYSDYWLCQINIGYHKAILSDWKNGKKFADWFYDPYKQLDYCYKLYSNWTKFYWYDVRHRMVTSINFNL